MAGLPTTTARSQDSATTVLPRRRCLLAPTECHPVDHRGCLRHCRSPRGEAPSDPFGPNRGLRCPAASSPTICHTGVHRYGRLPRRPVVNRSRLFRMFHTPGPRPCRASFRSIGSAKPDPDGRTSEPDTACVPAHPSLRGGIRPHRAEARWSVTRRWRVNATSTANIAVTGCAAIDIARPTTSPSSGRAPAPARRIAASRNSHQARKPRGCSPRVSAGHAWAISNLSEGVAE